MSDFSHKLDHSKCFTLQINIHPFKRTFHTIRLVRTSSLKPLVIHTSTHTQIAQQLFVKDTLTCGLQGLGMQPPTVQLEDTPPEPQLPLLLLFGFVFFKICFISHKNATGK